MRGILKQICAFAILHRKKGANPADDIGPALIATFTPKERPLSPTEMRRMLKQFEHVTTLPTIRLGLKLYLLTLIRNGALQDAARDEVDCGTSQSGKRARPTISRFVQQSPRP